VAAQDTQVHVPSEAYPLQPALLHATHDPLVLRVNPVEQRPHVQSRAKRAQFEIEGQVAHDRPGASMGMLLLQYPLLH